MNAGLYTIHVGDALTVLKTLADESIDCIVTSPPYWGLRDYGVEGQIGAEPTFAEFLGRLMDVFAQCHRVLKRSGTMWVNMGDSYSSAGKSGGSGGGKNKRSELGGYQRTVRYEQPSAKNLLGQPWRLAFALQDAGWILRRDIIWSKPDTMPESVADRHISSHEYIFHLVKSPKYFWDVDAAAEHRVTSGLGTTDLGGRNSRFRVNRCAGHADPQLQDARSGEQSETRRPRSVWTIPTSGYPGAHFATFPKEIPLRCIAAGCPPDGIVLDPFAGSGTTLAVAIQLGRRAVGVEINPQYVELIKNRLALVTPSLFGEGAA